MPGKKFVIALGMIITLLIGGLMPFGALTTSSAMAQTGTPSAATPSSEYPAVNIVRRVGPAVVTVINEQTVNGLGAGTAGQLQPAGSGTGFIIDKQGHIVTNWHVVTKGQKFQVIFANGETRPATLVGSDEISDLAVVKVSGDVPATVSFGDSSILEPGEPVLAIGSPLSAFTNTVTEGIVSAIGRNFPADPSQGVQNYTNLIQHDAAINPGNSGGPLLNLNGEVVGVNTLGIPVEQGQPVQGLFFAIPSNTVKKITDQLIANGKVVYPFIGVSSVSITPDVAAQAGLSVNYGVYVVQVAPGSPAADAKIQRGDVILSIDGKKLDENNSFTEVLFAYKPGDKVDVVILRNNKQMTVTVTLGERPAGS
ncbi:MAG: S1C family serine protease [Thermomicrobiales bacterium]